MENYSTIAEMQKASREFRKQGKRIGFVPTMGSLHRGHLALVDAARRTAEVVVLSVFINPTQFGPQEDFQKYPRDLEGDRQKAEEKGVGIFFHPTEEEIYPPGDQTSVVVTELTRGLCGPFRPGHFRGVTTVVTKLLNIVQPDVACFGEKDFQQLSVIKRMVRDLGYGIDIVGVPTMREADGLALSSRNQYLSPSERKEATNVYAGLKAAQEALSAGTRHVKDLLERAKQEITRGGNIQIEYLEIVDPESLEALELVEKQARILTAVRLGPTRLIDNLPLSLEPNLKEIASVP